MGMLHEADDELHDSAAVTTRRPEKDMSVALAKLLIDVGHRSSPPREEEASARGGFF